MISPSTRATTPVKWSIRPVSLCAITFPVARLVVPLFFGTEPPDPATAPESPAGWTQALRSPWFHFTSITSASCLATDPRRADELVRPTVRSGSHRFLARDRPAALSSRSHVVARQVPRSNPPGDPVPVLLGLEFFLAHQAELQLPLPPSDGSIVFPESFLI